MATGDQNDFVGRIRGALPKRWFPTSPEGGPSASPILDGVLAGLAVAWAWLYGLYADCYTQGRIATATLINLDMIAADYLGTRIQRTPGQGDPSFRATIQQEVLRPRVTRPAVVAALEQLTGQMPDVFAPANPSDTGGYNSGGLAYGSATGTPAGAGGYGDMNLPFQVFMTAYRPISPQATGLANVGGWGNPATFNFGAGGWTEGAMEWANLSAISGIVTDAMIRQCITDNIADGIVVWLRIASAPGQLTPSENILVLDAPTSVLDTAVLL